MGGSSLLCVMLTVSIGILIHLSRSLETPESVKITQSTGRNISDFVSLSSEAVFHSESSLVDSINSADSVGTPQLIYETVGLKDPERVNGKDHSGSGIALTMRPATTYHRSETHDTVNLSVTGHIHSTVMSEGVLLDGSHLTTEKQLTETHESTEKYDLLTGTEDFELPVQTKSFTSMTNYILTGPGDPCVPGVTPCTAFTNFNGTALLWDDMRRTLAFSWELHVFGSASLFTLMAVLAVLGMVGACTLPHHLHNALTLSNSFLIISGALRTALLLLDPYGTRQILPHATLAALHNVPLQLLLWAQVIVALVTLRGLKLLLFPLNLQHPWVVGCLGMSHCTILLLADLYSSRLSPALPLLLQTLSLCWGIPFCLGILTKSLPHVQPFLRSSFPQWVPSQKTERLGKRVLTVCAFVGILCCSLQMYSLLWLYGLLGNWRRFGWGWWITQFWARILELAWGFSLLFLGSWIFWTPSRGHERGDHGKGRPEVCKRVEEKSLWRKILASMQKGPLRKSEKSWEGLLPNNWAMHNHTRAGIRNNGMSPYDDEIATITQECMSDPVSISSCDSQAALLWQKVSDRECVLSLIEFDMRPPSPINLRRSIDNALYHGQLVAGGLFTQPALSWTHTMGTDIDSGPEMFPPPYVGHRWMLDTDSLAPSLDQFQAKEPPQSLSATPDYNDSTLSSSSVQKGEEFLTERHQHDWSDDDITDL